MHTLLGFYRFPCLTSSWVGIFDEPRQIENCRQEHYQLPYADIPMKSHDSVTEKLLQKGKFALPFSQNLRVYWPSSRDISNVQTLDLYVYYPVNMEGLYALCQEVDVEWLKPVKTVPIDRFVAALKDLLTSVKSNQTTRYEFELPLPFYVYDLLIALSCEVFTENNTVNVIARDNISALIMYRLSLAWNTYYADVPHFQTTLPIEFAYRYCTAWIEVKDALQSYLLDLFKYPDNIEQVIEEWILRQHTS